MGAKDSTVLDGERKMSSPVRIFYSYAHEDERLRGELEKHLSSLRRQGLIVEWHDRNISAGTEWKHEIDKYLNIADIILLLISPDFIASDYCYGIEMTRAMERHKCGEARVIPILLRPIDLDETPIEQLQSLPEDRIPISLCNNQDAAFRDVARGLRTAIKEIGNSASSSHHPSFVQRTIQTTPPTYESKNRQRLLSRVRAFWITGVLEHSLHNAALITLGLHEQPDAVENPWRLAVQELNLPSHPLPPGIRITQVYDDADGELLILGEPGSGKTTLLLELARDLLDRAERDGSYPMPVVFNLSSWAVKQQPIIDWLIEELNTKYQVQRELSQSWVQTDQILPLLDGLDEVTPRCRAACVEAINAYRREHSIVSTVVCSRSAEYLALMNRALLRTAVVVQPLTKQQIDDYLSKADGKLASVQTALRTNPVLEKFVTTPLILSVLALAYHGKPLEDLPMIGSSTAQLRQVFATYIERVLQHRRAKSNYTPRQMVCWLKWLAQQMRQHNLTIFYIEHMQPDWLSDGRSSRSYPRIVAGAVIGLFLGLISGLLIGINWGQIIGSFQGLLVGSFQGLLVGLVGGSLFGAIGGLLFGAFGAPLELVSSWMIEIKPAEIVDWSWVNMQRNILKALYYGCILGLISGVMSSFYDNPLRSSGGLFGGFFNQLLNELFYGRHSALFDKVPSGIFDGAAIGSITAFVIVLVSGISSKKLDNYARSIPNQGIWNSAHNALRVGFSFTAILAIVFVPLFILVFRLLISVNDFYSVAPKTDSPREIIVLGLSYGLIVALASGLVVGLSCGGFACIQHSILRLLLWHTRCIPWNYPRFLEDAAERILLQRVGGGYMFVHRLLLDYFASLDLPPYAYEMSAQTQEDSKALEMSVDRLENIPSFPLLSEEIYQPDVIAARSFPPVQQPVFSPAELSHKSKTNMSRRIALLGLVQIGIATMSVGEKTDLFGLKRHLFLPKDALVTYFGHSLAVKTITWSPDGTRIASGGSDGTVQVWNASNGDYIYTYTGHTDIVYAVTWSPDGTRIISTSGPSHTLLSLSINNIIEDIHNNVQNVQIWDATSGDTIYIYTGHAFHTVYAVTWSPDGKNIASGGDDGTVRIWDATTGNDTYIYKKHTSIVRTVTWSPDGKYVASGGDDGIVRIWDATNGNDVSIYKKHTSIVRTITWSPDGKYVASGGDDSTVRIWDTTTGNDVSIYIEHAQAVYAVSWSPNGTYLVSSDDLTVQIWNATDGELSYTYTGNSSSVNTVAWSPSGKYIASGGDDGHVQVWIAR